MSGHTDEDRARKIIIDSKVAAVAARGIAASQRGELSPQQTRALIAIDEKWIQDTRKVAPELFAGEE